MSDAPRHFLDLSDFEGADLRIILNDAKAMKAGRAGLSKGTHEITALLDGKIVALIFQQPSTRTRVSFEVGIRQLGGESLLISAGDLQLGRGETIADTAKVLSRFVDAIMIRAKNHEDLMELAQHATVPVINGLTNKSHPCQIMADILTLEEHVGPLAEQTIAWVGDGNNVAASFVHAVTRLGGKLRLASPSSLSLSPDLLKWARTNGADITVTSSADVAVAGATCVVTDAWVSMHDADATNRHNLLKPYQVNAALMKKAAENAIFMHCLPAHRGEEVTSEVLDGPQSVVFDEAEKSPARAESNSPPLFRPDMTRAEDTVMPFEIKPLGVRGRVVRLGAVIDDIVSRHDYPPVVSALLAEALALTAMLGATLKFEGKFILQTKTDGPVDMIVADFMSPHGMRGYARFNKKKLDAFTTPTQQDLLGKGYLAMTVDQGSDMERYQGIVPLDGTTLAVAADAYFKQSEQIPTRLRLVSGPLLARGEKTTHWRAGAIMVQHLPPEGGISPIQFSSGDNPEGEEQVPEDDNWVKAKLLLDTVEDHELLDPTLTSEELLYRLYHEDGVTVYPNSAIIRHCTCSPEAVQKMLKGFSEEDRKDMIENGEIKVICEFCSTAYRFDPETLEPLTSGSAPKAAP